MASNFDLPLIFSEIQPDDKGKAVNLQVCSVAMSHEHARALAMVLSRTVKDYEDKHGLLNPGIKDAEPNVTS